MAAKTDTDTDTDTVLSLNAARTRYPGAATATFADSRAPGGRLCAEVHSGAKTATYGAPGDVALPEGEDTALARWRAGHRLSFERNVGFDPGWEHVCERFPPIEDLR